MHSALLGLALLAAMQAGLADSSHILVIRARGDTARFAVDDTIPLVVGEQAELRPVLYDEAGTRLPAESLWWHNTSTGFIEFPDIDPSRASGTGNELVIAEFVGRDEIMLHGPNGMVRWVWFRVSDPGRPQRNRRGPAVTETCRECIARRAHSVARRTLSQESIDAR